MKVYVITKGDYSEYHICGVSLDKADAKVIAEKCSDEYVGEAKVEEYDSDEFQPFLKDGKFYRVWMVGETVNVERESIDYFDLYPPNRVQYYSSNGRYQVYVIARDKNHAKKIGLDKIYQYKYEKGVFK